MRAPLVALAALVAAALGGCGGKGGNATNNGLEVVPTQEAYKRSMQTLQHPGKPLFPGGSDKSEHPEAATAKPAGGTGQPPH